VRVENYGKVVVDCREAVKLNPKNVKAYFRGAKAANALEKYDEALKFCDGGLALEPKSGALLTEKRIAMEGREALQRRDQQKQKELQEKKERQQQLLDALRERQIVMGDFLLSSMRQYLESAPIYLHPQTKQIHWPVLFLYDEYHQSDFIKDFCEEDTFQQHLQVMFPEDHFVEWDIEKKYVWKNIEIYFIANQVEPLWSDSEETKSTPKKRKRKIRVKQTTTLKQVLQHKECVVPGFPVFYLVVAGTPFKEYFLKKPLHE
jgi:tetratricopeptide (TPR) repeat protein